MSATEQSHLTLPCMRVLRTVYEPLWSYLSLALKLAADVPRQRTLDDATRALDEIALRLGMSTLNRASQHDGDDAQSSSKGAESLPYLAQLPTALANVAQCVALVASEGAAAESAEADRLAAAYRTVAGQTLSIHRFLLRTLQAQALSADRAHILYRQAHDALASQTDAAFNAVAAIVDAWESALEAHVAAISDALAASGLGDLCKWWAGQAVLAATRACASPRSVRDLRRAYTDSAANKYGTASTEQHHNNSGIGTQLLEAAAAGGGVVAAAQFMIDALALLTVSSDMGFELAQQREGKQSAAQGGAPAMQAAAARVLKLRTELAQLDTRQAALLQASNNDPSSVLASLVALDSAAKALAAQLESVAAEETDAVCRPSDAVRQCDDEADDDDDEDFISGNRKSVAYRPKSVGSRNSSVGSSSQSAPLLAPQLLFNVLETATRAFTSLRSRASIATETATAIEGARDALRHSLRAIAEAQYRDNAAQALVVLEGAITRSRQTLAAAESRALERAAESRRVRDCKTDATQRALRALLTTQAPKKHVRKALADVLTGIARNADHESGRADARLTAAASAHVAAILRDVKEEYGVTHAAWHGERAAQPLQT